MVLGAPSLHQIYSISLLGAFAVLHPLFLKYEWVRVLCHTISEDLLRNRVSDTFHLTGIYAQPPYELIIDYCHCEKSCIAVAFGGC